MTPGQTLAQRIADAAKRFGISHTEILRTAEVNRSSYNRWLKGTGNPTMLTAERIGPQHIRSSVAARETARSLLRRGVDVPELRGLAERMGIAE